MQTAVELFIAYSHKDEKILQDEFIPILKNLKHQSRIQDWYDRKILAGQDWSKAIDQHINSADIILLFISVDFLASDYCYEIEMRRALERQQRNEAIIVPIIVRTCHWEESPFARFQAVPPSGKAITSWKDRDRAWTKVSKSLLETIRDVFVRKASILKAQIKLQDPALDVDAVVRNSQQARNIFEQLIKDAQRPAPQLMFFKDLSTKISELNKEIGPSRPVAKKRAEDAFRAVDDYIRG